MATNSFLSRFLLFSSWWALVVDSTTQFVALQPTGVNTDDTIKSLAWVQLAFEENATSIDEVSWKDATGNSELGGYDHMNLGATGFALTAKLGPTGDNHLYAFLSNSPIVVTGHFSDIDLKSPLAAAFASKGPPTFLAATHTFVTTTFQGDESTYALMVVQYAEAALNGTYTDAFVALSMEDGCTIKPTASGKLFFSIWDELGTTSLERAETIFRIQHSTVNTGEQWHMNGVGRFTTADGTPVVAFTHRRMNEAILITDPWITTSSAILQRFGTPALYNAQGSSMVRHHTFGLDPATGVVFSGVHNVHLESTSNSNETESITLFVNTVTGSDYSAVYEFDIKLVREAELLGPALDSVFSTAYRYAALGLQADAHGGARRLGSGSGGSSRVYLVGGGRSEVGLCLADTAGGFRSWGVAIDMYDPYVSFEA